MDRLGQVFSLTGRTSRLAFWRFQVWQALIGAAVWCLTIFITIAGGWLGAIPFLLLAPILAAGTCVSIRRLHDRDRSAWWLIAFGPGPYLLISLAHLLANTVGGTTAALANIPLLLGAIVLTVWAWIEIGFRRGTPGDNRYGPAPA
jgi:uncharacterized membrane protein YhaH (DUF805 family)